MRNLSRLTFTLLALLPALASAQALRVLQVRSAEDPNSPPDPTVCAQAPFVTNLRLSGTLCAYPTTGTDGRVIVQGSRPVGRATACARITSLAFPVGLAQRFFLRLSLPDGDYTASGTCTIVSNDVPKTGLVLAGCNLALVSAPAGVVGGAVTSLTTFNPFKLEGFTTGSYYTVQVYDQAEPDRGQHDSDHAMEWIGGGDDDGSAD
jgi:hypothetical protein